MELVEGCVRNIGEGVVGVGFPRGESFEKISTELLSK